MTTFLFFCWIFLPHLTHQILLSRLNSVFGIPSTALQSLILLRQISVHSSQYNSSSSPSQLMYGVPHGSVLGPILFVLYTMPLSDIIANHYNTMVSCPLRLWRWEPCGAVRLIDRTRWPHSLPAPNLQVLRQLWTGRLNFPPLLFHFEEYAFLECRTYDKSVVVGWWKKCRGAWCCE